MLWQSIDKVGRVAGPVLIHFLIANIISLLGLHADAASLASITAAAALPLFVFLYRKDCGERGVHKDAALCLTDALGIVFLGVAVNMLYTAGLNVMLRFVPLSNTAQEALFDSPLAVQLLGLGVLVPIMEEVLFRGLVYNRLTGYTKKEWSAAVLAAAVFAVYHGNLIQALFAFPMGLLIIAIYRRRPTLKAPILFHMAVNISSVLLTFGAAELT